MTGAATAWLRSRTPAELVALAAGILVLGWLGWDVPLWDPRQQLLLHLVAAGAIAGAAIVASRGGGVPHTPLDLPILALLAAYAAATASATNLGMSLRAMAAVLATAALLPIALLAIRHRPAWVGAVTAIPVLVLSVPTLMLLVARRVEWVLAGGPGLPPLRLAGEGTIFGSVAVPPFVIWPAWALAALIQPAGARRIVRGGLVATGLPLTILSGSRSAWLAMAVTVVVGVVPWAWRRRRRLKPARLISWRTASTGLGALAFAALAVVLVVPRLTAIGSVLYRAALWRDTLAAWSVDPLLGVGPGFMPYARQAAAADFTFPVRQPHSHNLALGVLGDAGIVGLVAALALILAALVVAGPWRARTPVGRRAALVLLGLGVAGLFEDLTFLPNFNLLAITLLAVALTDAGAVDWTDAGAWARSRRLAVAGVGLAAAVAVLPAAALADVAAIAYRAGVDAHADEHHDTALDALRAATDLDPWHPAGPKALAVVADAAGDAELARAAAERAVVLNPGDAPSWANLARLCEAAGDTACAERAAERTVARAGFLGLELANAAIVLDRIGQADAADEAYRRSLLSQWLTAFGLDWPRPVPIGEERLPPEYGAQAELMRLIARWAADEETDPDEVTDPAVRAVALAMRGDLEASEASIAEAIAATPDEPLTWQVAVVLRAHRGDPVDREQAIWHALVGRDFPDPDERPRRPRQTDDIASFRAYPGDELVGAAERLETDPIWPWALSEVLP